MRKSGKERRAVTLNSLAQREGRLNQVVSSVKQKKQQQQIFFVSTLKAAG
jgi:hypothetical protein